MEKKEEKKHRFLWLKIVLLTFLITLSTVLYACYLGPKGIKVKEYNVISDNVPTSFYGYKVIQMSDIHYNQTTNKTELKKIIKVLNKSKPDIIIISGDLLDKKIHYTDNDDKDLIELLNSINGQYKYIITGENDLNNEHFKTIINKTNFKLLDNTYEIIYNNDYEAILIGGISTRNEHLDISEKMASIYEATENSDVKYNILIMHEPSLIEQIDYHNFDLILAGHTHKGQLNIPGLRQLLMPIKDNRYINDHYKFDDTELYISSGIGTTNFNARIFNKPSINLYRLLNR